MEKPSLIDIQGVGKAAAERLTKAGYITIDDVAQADVLQLSTVSGFSDGRAERTISAAKELIGSDEVSSIPPAPTAAPGEAASLKPHPVKPEGINMTTDNTKTTSTPPATTQSEPPKAEAPKAKPVQAEAAKAAPKAQTKAKVVKAKAKAKAPAKKPAAKKSTAKKADAKPSATLKAAPKTGPKTQTQPQAPAAVATPKPEAPANTNKPSIFKEPGYIAAGVILALAAYGYAQQPGVQSSLGFASTDTVSTTTAALTTPASDAAPTSAVSAPTTPPASAVSNMPTYMQHPIMPGAMPGSMLSNGTSIPQQNSPAFAPAPNGAPQYETPQYSGPQYGGPQYGRPVGMAQNPQQTQAAALQASGQKAPPLPPFGPYSHPGYSGYGYGNSNGYGQGYGNGNFNVNFASRANSHVNTGTNTGAYGNSYNGYNGPAPYGYGPRPYPMPRAMIQPTAPARPISK